MNPSRFIFSSSTAVLTAVALFFSSPARATEVDNYTPIQNFQDSTDWLNQRMNQEMQLATDSVASCDQTELYRALYDRLGGGLYAKVELWSSENNKVVKIPIQDSIYQDVADKYISHFGIIPLALKKFYTESNLNLGGVRLGDDKLGHFISQGYTLFHATKVKKDDTFVDVQGLAEKYGDFRFGVNHAIKTISQQGDELALELNHQLENGQWGLTGPGVKSYGDMAANWEGYIFWQSLLGTTKPYFACSSGHFVKLRKFEWKDYVTNAWDESINCSEMIPVIDQAVSSLIARKHLPQCPRQAGACKALINHYGQVSKKLLSPACYRNGESK